VIVTLGAAGVVVLERVGSGFAASAARQELADVASAAAAAASTAAAAIAVTEQRPEVPEATAAIPGATAPASAPTSTPVSAVDGAPADAVRVGDHRMWEVPADEVATVDSTGAGDAFCGALAAALAEGRPLAEAVKRAVAGSALATTHVGAREGMPTLAELDEFLASR
jgi:ribokinase